MKRIVVMGKPRPQGSIRTLLPFRGSKPVTLASDPRIYDYRHDIQNTWLREEGGDPMQGPVLMHLTFVFARPASHYHPVNSKRTEPELKMGTPYHFDKAPDLDKLVRAVGDALTGFAYVDDRQVAQVHAAKVYGDMDHTIIEVMPVDEVA